MHKTTILFVDDEPGLSEVYVLYLRKKGYKVEFFKDATEAMLRYASIEPDLVLLDANMPVISGFDVAKAIRNIDPDIPIIFLSGLDTSDSAVRGLNSGANDYIRKDVDLIEVEARIMKELKRMNAKSGNRVDITPRTYIDMHNNTLVSAGVTHKLTRKEFMVLVILAENINNQVTRTDIIKVAFKDRYDSTNYLYKTVSKIRSAIKDDDSVKLIRVHDSICLLTVT